MRPTLHSTGLTPHCYDVTGHLKTGYRLGVAGFRRPSAFPECGALCPLQNDPESDMHQSRCLRGGDLERTPSSAFLDGGLVQLSLAAPCGAPRLERHESLCEFWRKQDSGRANRACIRQRSLNRLSYSISVDSSLSRLSTFGLSIASKIMIGK
jgi:hypothetical protein